jgi:ribonuclease HI
LHKASVHEHPKGTLQAAYHPSSYTRSDKDYQEMARERPQLSLTSLSSNPFYSHLFSKLTFTEAQGQAVADAIQQDALTGCSDGSFDPVTQNAAIGFVLADSTTNVHLLALQGPCIGHTNNRSAIRAELCSLTATTYFLLHIIERFGVNRGSLKLYNDCSKAVNLITNPGSKFKRYLLDDYDLICETQLSIQKLREKISFQLLWVKGHFTGRKKESQHVLNEEAHNLAKSALLAANQASTDISPPFISCLHQTGTYSYI